MKRSLNNLLIVLLYALFLRGVLALTIPVRFFQLGLFFDGLTIISIGMMVALLIKSKKGQKIFYGIFIFFWTFITVADVMYHSYFFTLTSRSAIQGLSLMSPALTAEYDLSIPWAMIGLFVLSIGVIVTIAKQKTADKLCVSDLKLLLFLLFIHAVVLVSFSRPKPDDTLTYYQSDAYLYRSMHDRVGLSESYGYYFYHLVDLVRRVPRIDEITAFNDVNDFFNQKTPHVANDKTGILEDMNLVKIIVESLDTRFIHPELTPTLHGMMTQGYRFDTYYVPVFQQGATCNSEFMSITGLYAINSNDYSNNICDAYNQNHFPYALPNQLRDYGYDTYYFHSGYRWFYNREHIVPNYGFETVKFQEDIIEAGYDDFYDRYDTHLMYFVDEYVDLSDTPFYIEFLTYALHGAYNHTDYDHYDPIVDQVYDASLDDEVRVYLKKLIEFDRFLTALVDALDDAGVYDDTLFVIYTDHYPYMMQQDTFENYTGIDADTMALHQQTLIMYNSTLMPTSFDQVGSTIDIVPTVLNLIQPNSEFKYFMGHDLMRDEAGTVMFQDLSVTDGTNRLTLRNGYKGAINALPDLKEAQEKHVTMFEIQKQLLIIDYFRKLEEQTGD